MEMNLSGEEWKYLLLPFIISSYVYEGKSYQIMVNGQNGDISGFRPVDRKKLNWSSILAFVPGILMLLTGLVANVPEEVLFGGWPGSSLVAYWPFLFIRLRKNWRDESARQLDRSLGRSHTIGRL